MKTKKKPAKKTKAVKRVKTTTIGELFYNMFNLKKAEYLDVWLEDETTEFGHESYFLSDIARIEDGKVHIYGIGSWAKGHKVKLKGNTAEVVCDCARSSLSGACLTVEIAPHVHKFRFYAKKPIRLS